MTMPEPSRADTRATTLTPFQVRRVLTKCVRDGWSIDRIARELVVPYALVEQTLIDHGSQAWHRDPSQLRDALADMDHGTTAPKPSTWLKSSHFNGSHPLAALVRQTCDHSATRVVLASTGCGQCWESVIVRSAVSEIPP